MTHRTTAILLRHMLDAAREARRFSDDRTRTDLERDRQLQFSLTKCIEIIGEAASRTDPTFREAHAQIPWQDIIAMRNRLIHAYFDINLDILWKTCRDELPELIQQLEQLLDA